MKEQKWDETDIDFKDYSKRLDDYMNKNRPKLERLIKCQQILKLLTKIEKKKYNEDGTLKLDDKGIQVTEFISPPNKVGNPMDEDDRLDQKSQLIPLMDVDLPLVDDTPVETIEDTTDETIEE